MPFTFACPHCGQKYKLADDRVGSRGRCAKCQQPFTVTGPEVPPTAVAAAPTPSPQRTDPAPRPDPATSAIPRQLGRFEVRNKLGQGTFGAVYRAFDAILKREVAIKLPHAAALALEGVGERFLREAEAAAQLHHPHIVPVHDAGVCDGQLYIASAFIDGQTLQSAMRDQPLDHRRAARLIMKLADALAYAHDKGIVHRDVKPGNVMLDSHDEPYVMDFGLARWEQAGSQLTQDGSLLGTPAYMSPEQAGAPVGKVGPASDQYALGVMLYEMLVGRVPFSDSQLPVVLSKIRDEEAVSPRSLDGSIPLDLETICLKAMSKRPQDRYVDGRALAADLRRWLDGEPIQARRLGVIERTVRWARKNKAVAGSLAAAAASLILVAVVSFIGAARIATLRSQELAAQQAAEVQAKIAESARFTESQQRILAEERLKEATQLRITESELRRTESELRALAEKRQAEALAALRDAVSARDEANAAKLVAQKAKEVEANERQRAASLAEAVQRDAYRLYIRDAQSNGLNGDAKRVYQSLLASRVTTRGWEHDYLYTQYTKPHKNIAQPSDRRQIVDFAISPDGHFLAYCESSGTDWKSNVISIKDGSIVTPIQYDYNPNLYKWGGVTKEPLVLPNGDRPTSIAFSANGENVAVGFANGIISLWNATSGAETATWPAYSQHERRIIDEPASKANQKTQRVLLVDIMPQPVMFLSPGPNDSQMLSFSVRSTNLWDVNGVSLRAYADSSLSSPSVAAITVDRNHLLTSDVAGNTVVYDVLSGTRIKTLRFDTDGVACIAGSLNKEMLAIADGSNSVYVFNAHTGSQNGCKRYAPSPVSSVCFTPNNSFIACGHRNGVLSIWKARGDDPPVSVAAAHAQGVFKTAFSRDGKQLFTGSGDCIKVWEDVSDTSPEWEGGHTSSISQLTFSPDGLTVVSASGKEITLWDAASLKRKRTLDKNLESITSVAVSPDSRDVACTTAQGFIKVWDTRTGRDKGAWNAKATGLVFGNDSEQVIAATVSGDVVAWEVKTQRPLSTIKADAINGRVRSLARSADNKSLFALGDINMFKAKVCEYGMSPLIEKSQNDIAPAVAFALSPDCSRVAVIVRQTTSLSSKCVVLSTTDGREICEMNNITGIVKCIVCAPDGSRIATASDDGTIRLWDATHGLEMLSLTGHKRGVTCLGFSPDGKRIVSGDLDGVMRIWDASRRMSENAVP